MQASKELDAARRQKVCIFQKEKGRRYGKAKERPKRADVETGEEKRADGI